MVADRVAALVRLQATPRSERRIALLMPDYPGAPGRTGYAVGLDVPASVVATLADLTAAGYTIDGAPHTAQALLAALTAASPDATFPLDAYARLLGDLPPDLMARIEAAWGEAADDPDVRDGAFRFRAGAFGNITVALAPDRGRMGDRRADYHDPTLPPRHALVAFGLWLRQVAKVDALLHTELHLLSRSGRRPPARHLSLHRQQPGRGGASQAPDRGRDHRASAGAIGRNRIVGRGAHARAPGR
jgi:cobaltochelatase CobN